MSIHLRQICLVADCLDPSVTQLSDILGIEICYVDPAVGKFGLQNSLLTVGSQFIEVVAPVAPGTAAGRYLTRRGGNGGYMVICQARTREIQNRIRANAMANQVRVAYESDRGSWNIMQLHPADMGAAFLETDWDENEQVTGNWHPAGGSDWHDTTRTDVVTRILAVELQAKDPHQIASRWSAVTGQTIRETAGTFEIQLENARIRFVEARDERGDGLAAIDLKAVDTNGAVARARNHGCLLEDGQIQICGTRINLIT